MRWLILYVILVILYMVISYVMIIDESSLSFLNFELHLFANQVSRVSRRLGINPEDIGNSNRRQGVQTSFVAKGLSGMIRDTLTLKDINVFAKVFLSSEDKGILL